MIYTPSQNTLVKYADLLINFALGGGKGIKPSDVVRLTSWESSAPLYDELYAAVIKSGGQVLPNYLREGTDRHGTPRSFFEIAQAEQYSWAPEKYFKSVVDAIDHEVIIISHNDPHALKGIEASNIISRKEAFKPYMDLRTQKELTEKLTWTIGIYGTAAMAAEAGLSPEDYWQQIIQACFLEETDPKVAWQQVFTEVKTIRDTLTNLPIKELHITGEDTDLVITLGENRLWQGCDGRNIPSFEIFTSPDWRNTHGEVTFDQPHYMQGQVLRGVHLVFRDGEVVKASAKEGNDLLQSIIKTPGGNRIGEFSLTDRRHSCINTFMANTLFDENYGGEYGNMHLALGQSYLNSYTGDSSQLSQNEVINLGFNASAVHEDIVQTTPRTVTAKLADGSEQVIYIDGEFLIGSE